MRLENKSILVTGAAGGLGREISLRCADEGADIILVDIDGDGLEKVGNEVEAKGRKAVPCVVDVRSKEQVQGAVKKAEEKLNRIDVLVNNAGVFSHIPFLELEEKEWDRLMDIHVKGAFLFNQAVLRHMVDRKVKGSLIHMSSISALIGFTSSAHYCTAKAAILHMSKALALEFGPYGIRSNVVIPGTFETQMNNWFLDDEEGRKNSLKSIPLGRFGRPEEIAHTVVFLSSDEAQYYNGASLLIDGGQTSHI